MVETSFAGIIPRWDAGVLLALLDDSSSDENNSDGDCHGTLITFLCLLNIQESQALCWQELLTTNAGQIFGRFSKPQTFDLIFSMNFFLELAQLFFEGLLAFFLAVQAKRESVLANSDLGDCSGKVFALALQ